MGTSRLVTTSLQPVEIVERTPILKLRVYRHRGMTALGAEPQVGAVAPGGNIAAMAGDSGGPVFVYHSDNTTVGASGMIQSFNTTATAGCGSPPDPRACGNHVKFTSAHATVNSISGASLYTGFEMTRPLPTLGPPFSGLLHFVEMEDASVVGMGESGCGRLERLFDLVNVRVLS